MVSALFVAGSPDLNGRNTTNLLEISVGITIGREPAALKGAPATLEGAPATLEGAPAAALAVRLLLPTPRPRLGFSYGAVTANLFVSRW
jgi:hypothetical protein